MKKISLILLSFGFLALSSCEDEALPTSQDRELDLKNSSKVLNFRAHLSGDNEVHEVESEASGQAIFKLSKDGMTLSYKILVDMIDNVTMAHIHHAPEGSNGPVVAWLFPEGPPPASPSGYLEGMLTEGTLTADDLGGPLDGMSLEYLLEEIYAGNTYVNVHTTDYPAGELRGQISGNMPGKN